VGRNLIEVLEQREQLFFGLLPVPEFAGCDLKKHCHMPGGIFDIPSQFVASDLVRLLCQPLKVFVESMV
jgi:hypothetical protein